MTRHRAIIGVTGWSGSGKTNLIVRLIPELARRGLRVATVKHAHHAFDIDKPGKDSFEHRAAGATEVAISSARRWAIVHENGADAEPSLDDILARLSPADIVIVEGYKNAPHPKIEVIRGAGDSAPIYRDNATIVAVATDDAAAHDTMRTLDINDAAGIAAFFLSECGLDHAVEDTV